MLTLKNYIHWSIALILGGTWLHVDGGILVGMIVVIILISLLYLAIFFPHKKTRATIQSQDKSTRWNLFTVFIFIGASMLSPRVLESVQRSQAENMIDQVEYYYAQHHRYPKNMDGLTTHYLVKSHYKYDPTHSSTYEISYKTSWWSTKVYHGRSGTWSHKSESILRVH